jgi:flagellar basal body rod protein FlgG
MLSALHIAAGGMNAASARLTVTAGNIANMASDGYKSRRVELTASPGGVAVGAVSVDHRQGPIDLEGVEGSNVDLVKESVDLILEKDQYTASAKVLKAADRMMGTLLDVLAK